MQHLRAFGNNSRMRRMLLGIIALKLTGSEANRMLNQFYSMDSDCSGEIDLKEMIKAAKEVRACERALLSSSAGCLLSVCLGFEG